MLPNTTIIGNVQRINQREANGKAITSVSISCGDKKKDGTYDNFYIDATFWENTALMVAKHFKEGSAIIVTGELITTNYDKNGTKVYKTELRFPKVAFVPRDRGEQDRDYDPTGQVYTPEQKAQSQQGTMPDTIQSEDIPFAPLKVV